MANDNGVAKPEKSSQERMALFLERGKNPRAGRAEFMSSDFYHRGALADQKDIKQASREIEWNYEICRDVTKPVKQRLSQGLMGGVLQKAQTLAGNLAGKSAREKLWSYQEIFAESDAAARHIVDDIERFITLSAAQELNHGEHAYYHPAGLRENVLAVEAAIKKSMGGGKAADAVMRAVREETANRLSVLRMAKDAEKTIEEIVDKHTWALPGGMDNFREILRKAATIYAERLVYDDKSLNRDKEEIIKLVFADNVHARVDKRTEEITHLEFDGDNHFDVLAKVKSAIEKPFREMQRDGRGTLHR